MSTLRLECQGDNVIFAGQMNRAVVRLQMVNLKGQALIDLFVGQCLRNAAGSMLSIPDVALAGPIIGDVFVPELERHLPTSHS